MGTFNCFCLFVVFLISLREITPVPASMDCWCWASNSSALLKNRAFHMGLCSILCGNLDGRGVWGRMDTCKFMAESLCCSLETVTTLLIGYTPIQITKLKKGKKKPSHLYFHLSKILRYFIRMNSTNIEDKWMDNQTDINRCYSITFNTQFTWKQVWYKWKLQSFQYYF